MLSIQEIIVGVFNSIGGLVCHQMPERSLQIGGRLLCVCSRDTGIYIGILVGLALLSMRRRERSGPPNLYLTFAMITPLILDGTTQAMGLRASTNQLRFLTGLLFGTAILPFLVYLLPILPLARRLPLVGAVAPLESELDRPTSWLPLHAFALGIGIDIALFLLIGLISGSTDPLLYWVISLPIMISLILTIFFLPAVVLVSFIHFCVGQDHRE